MARWGYISVDLIINIFVTIRLILILKEGIRNNSNLSQMTEGSKDKLFNAVNWRSYLQLGSTIFNILSAIEIFTWLKYGSVLTIKIFQNFNNVVFSYLITNDKEIVKMMAGEAARAKYFNTLKILKNLNKKSVTISFKVGGS